MATSWIRCSQRRPENRNIPARCAIADSGLTMRHLISPIVSWGTIYNFALVCIPLPHSRYELYIERGDATSKISISSQDTLCQLQWIGVRWMFLHRCIKLTSIIYCMSYTRKMENDDIPPYWFSSFIAQLLQDNPLYHTLVYWIKGIAFVHVMPRLLH